MNIFEMHDLLHSNLKAIANSGMSFVSTSKNIKLQGDVYSTAVNTASEQQGSPIHLKAIITVAGIAFLGYLLVDAFILNKNNNPGFFECRKLARKKSSS